MGNMSGKAKEKPLIVGPVPGSGASEFAVDFSTQSDHELATLTDSVTPNACYLPWKNRAYTECEINLGKRDIEYFFTADLSGCSLWYKFDSGKIKIRHESRTDGGSQREHALAGFKLVVDSNLNEGDIQLAIDESTMTKHAQFYVVYAILDYEEAQIDFRVQLVKHTENMLNKAKTYEVAKKIGSVVVSFPG